MHPGKKPASKKPMRSRQTTRPEKDFVQPIAIVKHPHTAMIELRKIEGRRRFSRILLGTSNIMYVMKKVKRALRLSVLYQKKSCLGTNIL